MNRVRSTLTFCDERKAREFAAKNNGTVMPSNGVWLVTVYQSVEYIGIQYEGMQTV